jgi:regulator of cell morphogenesis and NO signaling
MATAELCDSPPETLIGYIVGRHHARVRKVVPRILAHIEEAVHTDGERHPELREIALRFGGLAVALDSLMRKEETLVFPYFGALASAVTQHRPRPDAPYGSFESLSRIIEWKQDSVLDEMARIRGLTRRYTVPDDAGAAYRTCLMELEKFDRALHAHVAIETELLLPKVEALSSLPVM